MARSPIAGQPALTKAGAYDSTAAKQMQDVTCNGVFISYTGAADALSFPGNTELNSSGADACTLATPKAGDQPAGDDGKQLFIYDKSGQAHTITTAVNAIINSKHILTFNGTVGSNVELVARSGIWVVVGTSGVTVS